MDSNIEFSPVQNTFERLKIENFKVSQTGRLSIVFNKDIEIDEEKYRQMQVPVKARLLEDEEEDDTLIIDMQ